MFIPEGYILTQQAAEHAARLADPIATASSWDDASTPVDFDRHHRAISNAIDRLLQALSEGVLTAVLLDAESGGFLDVPPRVWRSNAGREALWYSRLEIYGTGRPGVFGAVLLNQAAFRDWAEPLPQSPRPIRRAELERWWADYVRNHVTAGTIPTREDDEVAIKRAFPDAQQPSRDVRRELRKLSPKDWEKRGVKAARVRPR
jgi:hypothetical protein